MAGNCFHLSLVLYLALCIVTQPGYSCPRKAVSEAHRCVKSISVQPNSNLVPIPGGASVPLINHLCKNKVYETAIKCVKKIYNSCPTNTRNVIQQFFNTTKLKAAWTTLCVNRMAYIGFIPCYQRQKWSIYSCLMSQSRRIARQIREGMDQRKVFSIVCSETRIGIQCQDMVLKRCEEDAAKIIRNFSEAVLPPICTSATRDRRSIAYMLDSHNVPKLLMDIRG